MSETVECWRCGAAKQEPGFPCSVCRVDIPSVATESKKSGSSQKARAWSEVQGKQAIGVARGNGYTTSLRGDASSSASASKRAGTLLLVATIIGVVASLFSLFAAITASDSYTDANKAQAGSALFNLFAILISYIITVPVFKYMEVRSREIAERNS